MKKFNFLKSKTKIEFENIPDVGKLFFLSDLGEYAYRGQIKFINFEYKIEIVFPTDNRELSTYQRSYFKDINKNLKIILDDATRIVNSKIELSKCKVICVLIPDINNDRYNVSAEIVVTQKKKINIFGKNIYSIIMKELEIVEIITI